MAWTGDKFGINGACEGAPGTNQNFPFLKMDTSGLSCWLDDEHSNCCIPDNCISVKPWFSCSGYHGYCINQSIDRPERKASVSRHTVTSALRGYWLLPATGEKIEKYYQGENTFNCYWWSAMQVDMNYMNLWLSALSAYLNVLLGSIWELVSVVNATSGTDCAEAKPHGLLFSHAKQALEV